MKDYVQGGTLTEVTDLILLSLYEPRHGYAIIQFVEEVTNGRVLLGAGTLYGALSSLEQKGWIKLQSTESTSRKKVYLITPSGKEAVQTEIPFLCQRTKPFIRLLHGRFPALRQTARFPADRSAAVPVLPAWLLPCPKRCPTLHLSTALP